MECTLEHFGTDRGKTWNITMSQRLQLGRGALALQERAYGLVQDTPATIGVTTRIRGGNDADLLDQILLYNLPYCCFVHPAPSPLV